MFSASATVEVYGEHVGGETAGFRGSWLPGTIQSSCEATESYVVLLQGVDNRTGLPWLPLTISAANVRPSPVDDSLDIPLAQRCIGDAVDCWAHDLWWAGFISETQADQVLVNFPCWPQHEDYLVKEAGMHQPNAFRIRTSRSWLRDEQRWKVKAPLLLPHYINKRHTEPGDSQAANAQAVLHLQSNQQKGAFSQHAGAAIQGPLQVHMLRHLAPRALAALRSTCRAFQQLVDEAPADSLATQALQLLPHSMAQQIKNGQDMLQMLLFQQQVLSALRNGRPARILHVPTNGTRARGLYWPPGWPAQSFVVSMNSPSHSQVQVLQDDLEPQPQPDDPLNVQIFVPNLEAQPQPASSSSTTSATMLVNVTSQENPWLILTQDLPVRMVCWSKDGHHLCLELHPADKQIVWSIDTAVSTAPKATLARELGVQGAIGCQRNGMLLAAGRRHVAVHDLITLEERLRVEDCRDRRDAPQGCASCSRCLTYIDAVDSGGFPIWSDWSPNGQLFAVAWGAGKGTGRLQKVTFHDSMSGKVAGHAPMPWCSPMLAQFESMAAAWSPASTHILLRVCSSKPTSAAGVAIISIEGSTEVLLERPGVMSWYLRHPSSTADWSCCGRYVNVISTKDREHADAAEAVVQGFIWDVRLQQRVFQWHADRAALPMARCALDKAVVWAESATACCISTCGLILSWPSDDSNVPEISMLWPRREAEPSALSPCGRLHVSRWSLPVPLAVYSMPSWSAADVTSSSLPRLHQLWHSVARQGNAACSMQVVQTASSHVHLQSIAWHPNPAARCLYAIMCTNGNLQLVDGMRHQVIRSWAWSQLSPEDAKQPKTDGSVCLHWSPDGSQLVVAAWAATAVVCFGPSGA